MECRGDSVTSRGWLSAEGERLEQGTDWKSETLNPTSSIFRVLGTAASIDPVVNLLRKST